jgi:tRNA(Ile)-lysidine synthase
LFGAETGTKERRYAVDTPDNKSFARLIDTLPAAPAYWVAYSGGMDSHVLLDLMQHARERLSGTLGAVHVDHQLHSQSGDWEIHCRAVCRELGVAFHALQVSAHARPGESPEAAARTARYRGLADWLVRDAVLLTAQHLDDQAETLLLQLLRGAGPRGLAAMPARARFGRGWLVRPLLSVPRADIEAYARRQRLRWVEDPSNTDLRYHRNLLRHSLMPELRQHWPGVAGVLARAAAHQADQLELAEALAREDMQGCARRAGRCLSRRALAALSVARQRNLLRHWIAANGLRLPSQAVLERIVSDAVAGRDDAVPLVQWPEGEVRRYRDLLYLMAPLPEPDLQQRWVWDLRAPLALEAAGGDLSAQPAVGAGLAMPAPDSRIEVGWRQGGEWLQPAGQPHRHALKKLFQQWGVPHWERARTPLLYIDGRLAAVAGLCVAEGYQARPGERAFELHWSRAILWQ